MFISAEHAAQFVYTACASCSARLDCDPVPRARVHLVLVVVSVFVGRMFFKQYEGKTLRTLLVSSSFFYMGSASASSWRLMDQLPCY